MCCSDCVSQECCGRLSDARHAKESEELQTSVRQASSRFGARKVQVKLGDGSLRNVNPRVLMAESEMNDMGHVIFFPRSDRGIKTYAYHESSGTKLELERVNGVFQLPIDFVPYSQSTSKNSTSGPYFFTFCSGTDKGHDGQDYDCGPPKLTGACNAVSPTKETFLQPLVSVGGSSGRRVVIFPIPGRGLLGERPVVPGRRERTEREEQLQHQIEGDAAQQPVVKAKKAPSAPSLDEWDGHLAAGHVEYRGWCPFRVAGIGNSEAHRRIEASRDHGHPELHLDYVFMGGETEDRASPNSGGQVLKRSLADHTPPRYMAARARQGRGWPDNKSRTTRRQKTTRQRQVCVKRGFRKQVSTHTWKFSGLLWEMQFDKVLLKIQL